MHPQYRHEPIARDTYDGHSLLPAVVRAKGQEKAIVVASELVGEVLGTGHDVEILGMPSEN